MEWSFPFADVDGDRMYSDTDFAEFYSHLFTNGIFMTIGSGLKIRESASLGMRVRVGSGALVINGRHYLNTEESEMQIPVASALQDRVDSIVVKLDLSNRTMQIAYKQSDITVVRTDTIYEMQIAKIAVARNTTQIINANITDTRGDSKVCGYSSPYQKVDVGNLLDQFESELSQNKNVFEAWFQNLKDQLDDNQAANLQNQIDAINGVIVQKNIPDGANLDEYKAEGEFSKKTPTVVTGAPEGVTGAFRLSVRTMLGSSGVFQTLYDYATRSMYYRIGNTTLGFNLPWKKVATTDDIKELTAGDTDGFLPLTMNKGFTANQAEYCIKNGWIYITVQGARPNSTVTGESYYTFLTLPAEITAHITHNEGFMWSNFQGGGTTYSGGILSNGQVQLYLSPKTNSLASNHRFSFNMTLPLRKTK
ncbi:pyocin knob domain-containing protein [Lactococcus garvieae]|uniref:pyocin knob domain-containing protein n=1 Tax=Lactococcus garvieae TaxID=1363 RepID=UPI0038548EDD